MLPHPMVSFLTCLKIDISILMENPKNGEFIAGGRRQGVKPLGFTDFPLFVL